MKREGSANQRLSRMDALRFNLLPKALGNELRAYITETPPENRSLDAFLVTYSEVLTNQCKEKLKNKFNIDSFKSTEVFNLRVEIAQTGSKLAAKDAEIAQAARDERSASDMTELSTQRAAILSASAAKEERIIEILQTRDLREFEKIFNKHFLSPWIAVQDSKGKHRAYLERIFSLTVPQNNDAAPESGGDTGGGRIETQTNSSEGVDPEVARLLQALAEAKTPEAKKQAVFALCNKRRDLKVDLTLKRTKPDASEASIAALNRSLLQISMAIDSMYGAYIDEWLALNASPSPTPPMPDRTPPPEGREPRNLEELLAAYVRNEDGTDNALELLAIAKRGYGENVEGFENARLEVALLRYSAEKQERAQEVQGIGRKVLKGMTDALEAYTKLPSWKKFAISAGLITGAAFGAAAVSGGGLAAFGAAFAGGVFNKAVFAPIAGMFSGSLVNTVLGFGTLSERGQERKVRKQGSVGEGEAESTGFERMVGALHATEAERERDEFIRLALTLVTTIATTMLLSGSIGDEALEQLKSISDKIENPNFDISNATEGLKDIKIQTWDLSDLNPFPNPDVIIGTDSPASLGADATDTADKPASAASAGTPSGPTGDTTSISEERTVSIDTDQSTSTISTNVAAEAYVPYEGPSEEVASKLEGVLGTQETVLTAPGGETFTFDTEKSGVYEALSDDGDKRIFYIYVGPDGTIPFPDGGYLNDPNVEVKLIQGNTMYTTQLSDPTDGGIRSVVDYSPPETTVRQTPEDIAAIVKTFTGKQA